MICPKCGLENTSGNVSLDWECPQCGVVYSKYKKIQGQFNTDAKRGSLSIKNLPGSDHRGRLRWLLIILAVLSVGYYISLQHFGSKPPDSIKQPAPSNETSDSETLYIIPEMNEMKPEDQEDGSSKSSETNNSITLSEARQNFKTNLQNKVSMKIPVEKPPENLFQIVQYQSSMGPLSAYLSLPLNKNRKFPAIIWMIGGFSNSIDSTVWLPATPDNDQSARAFRKKGIITMYPSLRGGNMNPGYVEGFYGEVDDILSAYDFLTKQKYVDSKRIYLGGHSTGGTLALLAAESTNKFRAVFSLGPTGDIRDYEAKYFKFDLSDQKEWEVRSPIHYLDSIVTPTYIFEGNYGNVSSLIKLQKISKNKKITFSIIPEGDHFSIISPLTKIIAQKIIQDTSSNTNISFKNNEIKKL